MKLSDRVEAGEYMRISGWDLMSAWYIVCTLSQSSPALHRNICMRLHSVTELPCSASQHLHATALCHRATQLCITTYACDCTLSQSCPAVHHDICRRLHSVTELPSSASRHTLQSVTELPSSASRHTHATALSHRAAQLCITTYACDCTYTLVTTTLKI